MVYSIFSLLLAMNCYWKVGLRLFKGNYSFVNKEDNRTIVLILIWQSYLLDTVVGYFHLPLALSHVCQQSSSYTLGDRKKMQCVDVFLIVLQKWIPVAVSKNGTNTLGIRFSASINRHSSIDVSGICVYTSWHLDAHLKKKKKVK